MLKNRMFSVHDVKCNTFLSPFIAPTNGSAIRSFSDIVNQPESVIHKHPEDYNLYFVGEFEQDSGALLPLTAPVFLESALNLLPSNGQG